MNLFAKIKNFIFTDISETNSRTRLLLKILSLLFAAALWMFVSWDNNQPSLKDFDIPLKYTNLPEGYSISNTVRDISVTVEGKVELVTLLSRDTITASVSMQDLRPGKYRLPVQVSVPDTLRVASYSPREVEFELYRIMERTMRPSLVVSDEIPDGYSLGDVEITPAEIKIRGNEAEVLAVRRAEVTTSASELQNGYVLELPISLMGENGVIEDLAATPQNVRVSAHLVEASDRIRVPVKVEITGTPGSGAEIDRVTVSPDIVTLHGPKSALSNISEIRLDIDITGNTEEMVVTLPIETPASNVVVEGAETVNVVVDFKSLTEKRTFENVPVEIRGSAEGVRWNVFPPALSVTIERLVNSTEPFNQSDPPVALYVDMTNVVSHSLSLPVLTSDVPAGYSLISVDPGQIHLTRAAAETTDE